MIYINGLGNIEDKTVNSKKQTTTNATESFDSVLESETIVYAVPENGVTNLGAAQNTNSASRVSAQNVTATSDVVAPEDMEPYFAEAAQKYGVSIDLLKAIAKVESNFNASCVSSAGAMGVMQLMPGTAADMGVKNSYDARESILGGAKYISSLLKMFNQDLSLALAAYNAGPGNVQRYGGIPSFSETQKYVPKVLDYLNIAGSESTTDNADSTDSTNSVGVSANAAYAMAAKDYSSTSVAYTVKAIPTNSL